MAYHLDQGTAHRLGLVVLSTDETLETEAREVLAGRDVGLYHSRIYSANAVTPQSLKDMEARMVASAELLPGGLQTVGYGCTSASVLIGPEAVARKVQEAQPGVPVTNPLSGVIAALAALQAKRIAMVTPYTAQVAAPMRAFLEAQGVSVVTEISFGEADDRNVARISEASTEAAAIEAARGEGVQAIFASCTNLRTFGVIDAIEAKLGVPVVSSNQALMWHMLALAGADARGWGPGRLFDLTAGAA